MWPTHPKVEQVHEGPAYFLTHARDGVNDDLTRKYEDGMDEPCALDE